MTQQFKVKISDAARQDVANILTYTNDQFGTQIQKKYSRLIQQAIKDVQEDPERPGVKRRPEICDIARTYHIFYSRDNTKSRGNTIKKPRHLLLFRISEDNELEIGRILHDSMELELHLPNEY
ncbi:MAG: toxin ParE1/3/4 [Candidatus Omnitrophota bacterium]|jgi:toxin ParE1/3/4